MGTIRLSPCSSRAWLLLALLGCFSAQSDAAGRTGGANTYYGRYIGSLESEYHGIRGDVYSVDARTLFVKGFSYDGTAQDTVFYAGSSPKPGTDGFIIPNEDGSIEGFSRAYYGQDLTLTLPEGKTIKEVRWLTVWNRGFSEPFGEIRVPSGFDYPRPQRLNPMSGIHQVSSDRIYVVDAQTFLLPNFTYDGAAPDAFFWVGSGSKPGQEGVQVPDENGKLEPLRRYDTKTLVLTLPGDLTVFDIEWLSVWCRAFGIDFGHIRIPKNLNVPPSLKMLGVAPQAKLNCEVLWDDLALEVRWAVAGETIVLQLVGKIDDGQYVAFGPSGDNKKTRMVGADVAVGWLDRATGKGFVLDHYMTGKGQCTGGKGVCQDTLASRGVNNIRLLNAALVNDYVMLTYQRPLKAQDEQDKAIITNGTQAVIWAVGSLNANNEPTYHKLRNKGDLLIDFGRSPFWNCPAPEEPTASHPAAVNTKEKKDWTGPLEGNAVAVPHLTPTKPTPPVLAPPSVISQHKHRAPWYVPAIECFEPENHVFYAHIGPTGGSQGYNAITGQIGWGISWYINGLLIPEVTVVRGQTYTFVVEGGQDADRPSRYHPMYITNDPEGGYEFKTPAERSRVQVYAGVAYDRDGHPAPTAQGRLCEWVEDPAFDADSFSSFGAFQRTLKLHCEEGEPSILQWTPDDDTPDTVYYQCYTHRFLGWKIKVVDSCDGSSDNRKALNVRPPTHKAAPPSSRTVNDETDLDYYDETPARPSPTVPELKPEHRSPDGDDDVPFASGPQFPTDFDDFIKNQSFGKQEERPSIRPPRPNNPASATRPNLPHRNPSDIPPHIVNAQGQKPNEHNSIDQLNKLVNQASPLGQKQPSSPQQNLRNPPPRKQIAIERPIPSVEFRRPPQQVSHQEPLSESINRPVTGNRYGNHNQRVSGSVVQGTRPVGPPGSNDRQSFQSLGSPIKNDGFNPGTVIFESGFKPIRKADGPIPPLGFEVEEPASRERDSNHAPDVYNHNYNFETPTDRPSLITLDPVFVASDPDVHIGRPKNSAPVTLPKAVVPVVPGPAQAVARYPPIERPYHQQQPQQHQQQQHLLNGQNHQQPPQFRQIPVQLHQRPPVQTQSSPVAKQDTAQRNKQRPGFSNFFGLGGQRRQQHVPSGPSRSQLPQQQGGNPSKKRRPNYEQQEENLNNRNAIVRPSQGLTGILQRFLGVGDRRKDIRGQGQQQPSRHSDSSEYPKPVMTFQGPLPPVIAKVHSASQPNFGDLHRSDNVARPNVLDSYSASLINGGSLMGVPGGPYYSKAGITDSEKAQLERFLFGPGEYFSPRGFGISSETTDYASFEDMVTSDSTDLPEGYTDDGTIISETIGTETPFDLSTGGQLEEDKPTENQQNMEEKKVPSLPEKSADEVESNAHPGEEDPQKKFRSLNREKRQTRKEEDQNSHQHLDHESNPDEIESSRLPVEHRGMGDMEDDVHHEHNSCTPRASLFSNVALTLSTLLLFYLSF